MQMVTLVSKHSRTAVNIESNRQKILKSVFTLGPNQPTFVDQRQFTTKITNEANVTNVVTNVTPVQLNYHVTNVLQVLSPNTNSQMFVQHSQIPALGNVQNSRSN